MSALIRCIKLLTIFLLLQTTYQQISCHYSCKDCESPQHQYCITCKDGYELTPVRSPTDIPTEYRRRVRYPTGVCTNQQSPSGPNVFGIILLISALILIPITRSSLLFYITSTLQALSLFALIEVGWLTPVSYLLNSIQYLSPCNVITKELKQNSWEMKLGSYNYIQKLFVQPDLEKSFALLGLLNVIVFALIPLTHFIKFVKTKYFQTNCRSFVCLSERGLKLFVNYLNGFYFLLIQETILSFVVAFQFLDPSPFTIAALAIYILITLLYLVHIAKFKITLFQNRLIQYYAVIKKIIYPIFVVVPFKYQYFLIALMIINCSLEGLFDYKINAYPIKSRNTVFKIIQFVTIIFVGVFYAVDNLSVYAIPVLVFTYALTVLLSLAIGFFYLEAVFSIKQNIQKKEKKEEERRKKENELVPEMSVIGRNNTNNGMLSTTKRQQRRQSTQQSFMESGDHPNKLFLTINHENKEIDEPQKAERQDTKDQSQKKQETQSIPSDIEVIQLEQSEIKKESSEKEEENKLSKQIEKKRNKNKQELRKQLRKRYGV